MQMLPKTLSCLAIPMLAACGGGESNSTPSLTSQFATPNADANFDIGLTGSERIRFSSNGTEGFAYVLGQTAQGDLVVAAGLLPGTDTRFWPGTGTATYAGGYSMGILSVATPGPGEYSTSRMSGSLSLTADFADNRLTGGSVDSQTGTIRDGTLTVDADMSGRFMTGTATIVLDGQPPIVAELQGRAGSDAAYGVFHGTGDGIGVAGGFDSIAQLP